MSSSVSNQTPRAMFAEERRQAIVEILLRDSHVLVNDLVKRFNVSAATLRNDLRSLEEAGLLCRTHGGAILKESQIAEQPVELSSLENSRAKASIGRAAAGLVSSGDALFCDSGSTVLELVKALEGTPDLTVITHDLTVARMAETSLPRCEIIMPGGVIRQGFHYMTGSMAVKGVENFAATHCFLATTAFSFKYGLTAACVEAVGIKRAYMNLADQRILLMDAGKIGHYTPARFATLDEMDVVVTDDAIAGEDRERIETMYANTRLIIA